MSDWTELAVREGDGLEVSLLWDRTGDRVKVVVVDTKLDQVFDLYVARAQALAAFNHPFVYAGPIGREETSDFHLQAQS
jgi:hypothetical protein